MRQPPAFFSRTTCLCTRPSRPGSDAVERIVQSACAVAARPRKKKAHLKRMSHMSQTYQTLFAELRIPSRLGLITVFLQQRLKTPIAPQRIPNRIYFQNLDRHSAGTV